MLSSEEVEIAEPRLFDSGTSPLSPLELADECPERGKCRLWPGLDKKLVKLHSLRNLLPLALLLLPGDPLCVDTHH